MSRGASPYAQGSPALTIVPPMPEVAIVVHGGAGRVPGTAERNTRAMLTGLLRGLGFERITIRFRAPQV